MQVDFEYKEEHHLVEGVVHQYDPSEHEHEEWTKVKLEHVPLARVVAWRTSRAAGAMSPLQAVPKIVQSISRQLPSDSRRQWESATSKLLSKEYGEATRAKFGPRYFERDIQSGVPTLTQAGREALEAEIKYEHEDENKDGVERDNGGAPASSTRLHTPALALPVFLTHLVTHTCNSSSYVHPAPSTAAERQGDRQSRAASITVTAISRVYN
ncbi:hypothetical protein EDB84DRAFT_1438807 [Lactarius hengduanensis]|nr:hypothetical protein EDB84DRAFT_1438807 [Lactarius hengduanensis]